MLKPQEAPHVSVHPSCVQSLPWEEHGWLVCWSKEDESHVEQTWTQAEAQAKPTEPHPDQLTPRPSIDPLSQSNDFCFKPLSLGPVFLWQELSDTSTSQPTWNPRWVASQWHVLAPCHSCKQTWTKIHSLPLGAHKLVMEKEKKDNYSKVRRQLWWW